MTAKLAFWSHYKFSHNKCWLIRNRQLLRGTAGSRPIAGSFIMDSRSRCREGIHRSLLLGHRGCQNSLSLSLHVKTVKVIENWRNIALIEQNLCKENTDSQNGQNQHLRRWCRRFFVKSGVACYILFIAVTALISLGFKRFRADTNTRGKCWSTASEWMDRMMAFFESLFFDQILWQKRWLQ